MNTCTHSTEERLVAADGLVADGFCPICLRQQRVDSARKIGLAIGALEGLRFHVSDDIKTQIDSVLKDLTV